jgi:hypothetical protein
MLGHGSHLRGAFVLCLLSAGADTADFLCRARVQCARSARAIRPDHEHDHDFAIDAVVYPGKERPSTPYSAALPESPVGAEAFEPEFSEQRQIPRSGVKPATADWPVALGRSPPVNTLPSNSKRMMRNQEECLWSVCSKV